MHHVDWFPTLLDAAGIHNFSNPDFPLHGFSQWETLRNPA
jgi:hypothetical protein